MTVNSDNRNHSSFLLYFSGTLEFIRSLLDLECLTAPMRLPITELLSSEIRDFSGAAARRVEFTVGVAYHEDTQKVISIIRRNLEETLLVLLEPEADIYLDNLGDSSVNLNVWCWAPFSEWMQSDTNFFF